MKMKQWLYAGILAFVAAPSYAFGFEGAGGYGITAILLTLVAVAFAAFTAISFRRVVTTNEVHIVQYSRKTISYGNGATGGNVYYEWPKWLPVFGVSKTVLPVSVFSLDIQNYEAYDEGRLPFLVHVKAFFRIADSNTAAQRVSDFRDLNDQLMAVVQGAVRSILATSNIEEIMTGRAKFGQQFTEAVQGQLSHWGVESVKNIEFMDIRDTQGSKVIYNITSKRYSEIEKESRVAVAKNGQAAQVAEIEAAREVQVQKQDADQAVGLRTVENKKKVALADQESQQAIKEAQKATAEREMAVLSVNETRKAEIASTAAVIRAKQDNQTTVIAAEAQLEAAKRTAEGVKVNGIAKADAEKAMQLAPVEAQITLAKEIGGNQGYQSYLVTLEKVKATQAIGIAQAGALNEADVKIIVNGGTPSEGITKVMDLFSSKGGTEIGAMFEALSNTPTGKDLLDKILGGKKAEEAAA